MSGAVRLFPLYASMLCTVKTLPLIKFYLFILHLEQSVS
jgi:hypothetical protein